MSAVPSCPTCDARCCRSYVVPISGADAVRISRAHGLPIESFAVAVPEDEPTPTGFLVVPDGPTHSLALDRRTDGACVHLSATGLCTVYEDRPLTCRAYPRGAAPDAVVCRGLIPDGGEEVLAAMDAEWAAYAAAVLEWNRIVEAGPAPFRPPEDFFAFLSARHLEP